MYKSKLTRILLAAAMALPLAASADEGMPPEGDHPLRGPGPGFDGPRGEMRGGPHGMPFLHGLDLSDSQDDKLFQLMYSQEPYMREQQRAHDKAMRALHELGNSDKYDDAAAAKLAQAAAQAQANLMLAHIRTHQKVLALLTPEQRKQLEERRARPPQGAFHER